jgi:SPP1 gp7 family putative phage head morphogenesis protein
MSYPLHLEKTAERLYLTEYHRIADPIQKKVIAWIKENIPESKNDSAEFNLPPLASDYDNIGEANNSVRTDAPQSLLELRKEYGQYVPPDVFKRRMAANVHLIDAHAKALVNRAIVKVNGKDTVRGLLSKDMVQTKTGLKPSVGGVNMISGSITEEFTKQAIKQNINLVGKLHDKYSDAVDEVLRKGFIASKSQKELIADIMRVSKATETEARFWAQDQAGNFFSEINRKRSEAAGFPGYIWRTQNDNHVRDTHARLEGTYHRWDDPPDVPSKKGGPIRKLHPGQDWRCRCDAESAMGPEDAEREYFEPLPTGSYEKYGKSKQNKIDEELDPIHEERARPFRDIFKLPGRLQVTQNYVENVIWSLPYEVGSVFKNGVELFSKRGTISMVKFHKDECALMANATLIHNHPAGKPFSIEDLKFAIANKLHDMIIITGTPYSIKYVIQPRIKIGTDPKALIIFWGKLRTRRDEIYLKIKEDYKKTGKKITTREIMEKTLTGLSKEYNLNFEIIKL